MLYAAAKIRNTKKNAKIIFVEFTHALIKMLKVALDEMQYAGKDIDPIKIVTYYEYMKSCTNTRYDYVFCDEVQDVPKRVLDAMRANSKRVIIAGDANQSIYKQDPKYQEKPVDDSDIQQILNPKTLSLNIVHRLSRNIMNAINSFIPNMNIMTGRISMIRLNVQIRLWHGQNKRQEVHSIMEDAIETININDSVAILLPTHNSIKNFANLALTDSKKIKWEETKNEYGRTDFNALNIYLDNNGIPMQYVANGYGDLSCNKIMLTTYHSAKGLDFDKVFIPFIDDFEHFNGGDNWTEDDDKKLFMVALTRSRKDLILSYTNHLNSYVKKFANKCLNKELVNQPR